MAALHFLSLAPQNVEIIAVELDGHLRLDAGEHVRNQVRERLLDGGDDARNVGQRLADLLDDFFARAFGMRVDGGDDLRDVDALGMFVEFRATGLANEGGDVVDLLQSLLRPGPTTSFDLASDVPGGSSTLICMAPSLNGGRKSRSSRSSARNATPTAATVTSRIGFGKAKAEADDPFGNPLQRSQHEAVLLALHELRVAQAANRRAPA